MEPMLHGVPALPDTAVLVATSLTRISGLQLRVAADGKIVGVAPVTGPSHCTTPRMLLLVRDQFTEPTSREPPEVINDPGQFDEAFAGID